MQFSTVTISEKDCQNHVPKQMTWNAHRTVYGNILEGELDRITVADRWPAGLFWLRVFEVASKLLLMIVGVTWLDDDEMEMRVSNSQKYWGDDDCEATE